METIGTMIANARKARNLWMKDLVPHLLKEGGEPISVSYLGLIEQDRSKPSPGLLPQLSEELGIPEDAFTLLLGFCLPISKRCFRGQVPSRLLMHFRWYERSSLLPMRVRACDSLIVQRALISASNLLHPRLEIIRKRVLRLKR